MSRSTPLLDNPEFVADLQNLRITGAAIGRKWGIAKSAVNKWRSRLDEPVPDPLAVAHAAPTESLTGKVDVGPDGGEFIDVQTTSVITDWSDVFKRFNLDPASFEVVGNTVRMSTWQQSKALEDGSRDVVNLFSYRASFRRVRQDDAEFASILERISNFTYVPAPKSFNPEAQIVVPCDLQVGKVDWNGNTDDTVAQALESFAKAAEFAREFRPAELCIVDAGDPIENIYNTASQLGTNDSDLPRQIEVAHNIFLSGIEMLAPLVPKLRYAAVSSNHGQQRLGPKSPAGDAHADYGLGIAKMIRRGLELNPGAFRHVTVQTPDPYMESLYFWTCGSDIGVVHGHQAGQADKLGEWWKGQSHGNMPVSKARILIAGHFHSLRYYQSGDSRHVFVGPASDRGSSWFTNLKGESSESGMLMFTTRNNAWDNLRVI